MADTPKPSSSSTDRQDWVCYAGPDPNNKATRNAALTIFQASTGLSFYHVEKKAFEDNSPTGRYISNGLRRIGIDAPLPDRHGFLSYSRENAKGSDPLELTPEVSSVDAGFIRDGNGNPKLASCRINPEGTPDISFTIPVVDSRPELKLPPPAPSRKIDVTPSLSGT